MPKKDSQACLKHVATPWIQSVIFCFPSLASKIKISYQCGHNTSNTLQACKKISLAVWWVYMKMAKRWKLCISPFWKKIWMSRYDEDMCEAISIATLNVQQDSSNSFICCKLIPQTNQHRTNFFHWWSQRLPTLYILKFLTGWKQPS